MADDPYSLDSLLEDLDEVVVHQNKETEQKSSKFVPHPPARDKFAAHSTTHNPKTRFAVKPGTSSQCSPELAERPKASATDADENSIDNLLNLLSSPPTGQHKGATASTRQPPFSPTNAKPATTYFGQLGASDTTAKTTTLFQSDHSNSGFLRSGNSNTQHQTSQAAGGTHHVSADPNASSGFSSPFDSPTSSNDGGFTEASTSARKVHPSSSSRAPEKGGESRSIFPSSIGHHPSSSSSSGGYSSGPSHAPGSTPTLVPLDRASTAGFTGGSTLFGRAEAPAPAVSLQDIMGGGSDNSTSRYSGGRGAFSQPDRFLPNSINSMATGTSAAAGSRDSKARCCRVVIAGSAVERGRKTSSFVSIACNNLRCLQCNFKVHCFSGSAWDESVDYLFLRNTVPNEAKLAARLRQSGASCAYCCQCSFATEAAERELLPQASKDDPQWICAGH